MCDQMIVVKFAKTLFNTTHDVLLICVYVIIIIMDISMAHDP